MATIQEIVGEFRTAVAGIATTRAPAKTFLAVPEKGPTMTPKAGADQFHVMGNGQATSQWFGQTGTKQDEATVVVQLLHAPFKDEPAREGFLQRDIERVRDILEMRAWSTSGVQAVFFSGPVTTVRQETGWRETQLTFRVVYTGTVATS